MKNYYSVLRKAILALAVLLSLADVTAQDTTIVQTFTFDSIHARRGKFVFPDDPGNYSKILMYYTLKCDPCTPYDKYNCGEWDYLTYTFVYDYSAGKTDSTKQTYLKYRAGIETPMMFYYLKTPTTSKYKRYIRKMVIDEVKSETVTKVTEGTNTISLQETPLRLQFLLTKAQVKGSGFTKGVISKMKFFVNDPVDELKNFTVRMKNSITKEITGLDNEGLTEVYHNDLKFPNSGWNEIVLTNPYNWTGISNLMIDISYESSKGANYPTLTAVDTSKSVIVSGEDYYLSLDGRYDYVDCGRISALEGATRFTLESWVRIDQWESWNTILGKGDRIAIQAGGDQGQIYCIVRNPHNTYANAKGVISTGEWTHLAMVYDGTQANNKDRIKLFVNGSQIPLVFTCQIPTYTSRDSVHFTLSGISYNEATLKGGIDEVRVWSTALSDTTIKNWMNRSVAPDHPNYQSLEAYYPIDKQSGYEIKDFSAANGKGILIGVPEVVQYQPNEIRNNFQIINYMPNVTFVVGSYTSHIDTTVIIDEKPNPPMTIRKYTIQNHSPQIEDMENVWESGFSYTYDESGSKIDSTYYAPTDSLKNDTLKYYSAPSPTPDRYEIGRFITPYGINLDLGPTGFTWVYDVTDYAPLLKDSVDLEAGNLQELIDLKFVMIKGTPPRKVLKIDRIWGGMSDQSYKNLSDDKALSAKEVTLVPEAKQFKVKTRLTGHGHQSNNGQPPWCCEWKDNIHYLKVNGKQVADWHIFQYDDCALNPVYPQGGTWPGAREGWCPGDLVKDNDFEITKYIDGNKATIDYDITKVPDDNQGMGSGNYVINMDLIEYSAPNFTNDAEIYNIITPNDFPYYSRKNPICESPTVIVRNNNSSVLQNIEFDYSVSGGVGENFIWEGSLEPNEKMSVKLPISGSRFWAGDGKNIFTVKISNPNGKADDNPSNDVFSTKFKMPDLYKDPMVICYQTNLRPEYYTLEIKDMDGNVVFTRNDYQPNKLYKDTLNLPDGCYSLNFTDPYDLGLSYWAYPDQGNGYIQIRDLAGKLVKAFEPDCGRGYFYAFNKGDISHVPEPNWENVIALTPNPTNNIINVAVHYDIGEAELQIYNDEGRLISSEKAIITESYQKQFNVEHLASGLYFIRILNKDFNIKQKFIKK